MVKTVFLPFFNVLVSISIFVHTNISVLLDKADAQRIMTQIALAVRYMHSRSVLHRDIKPRNIILETHARDSKWVDVDRLNLIINLRSKFCLCSVKLVDFGFAMVTDDIPSVRPCKYLRGTRGFMAPEVSTLLFKLPHHT